MRYTEELEDLAVMLADETDGAVSVYIRFNPELTSPMDSMFWVETDKSKGFQSFPVTDLSAYDEDDVEHVGWYYIPVRAGHPIWVEPYMNKEMDMYVTSYVVPIYSEGTLLGVVGMDIEFLYIMKMVDEICLYDTGHAFFTDNEFRVTYSKHLPKGDKVEVLMDAAPEADEFLCTKLKQSFEETVARVGKEIHLSVAIGSAQFDPALDEGYETVFERADSEMYQRKQELKGGAACR